MLEALVITLLAAGCLWAVASPFVRRERGQQASRLAAVATEAAKESKYREIRDAETDYRSGKLSEPEWRQIDAELRNEAAALLDRAERQDAGSS